jgi:hypothetical protein
VDSNVFERSRRRWVPLSLVSWSTDGPQNAPPARSHRPPVPQVVSVALHRCVQSKESVSPPAETLHSSIEVDPPVRGPARAGAGQADRQRLPACSARNLPVVVLVDGHGPPLIEGVDDIGFGFKGKLKRPHGHLVVVRLLLVCNVVLQACENTSQDGCAPALGACEAVP